MTKPEPHTLEEHERALVDAVARDRALSRRRWMGGVLACAAYEVVALGAAGCATHRNVFRADDGPKWSAAPLGTFRDGAWAGLQIGTTTVEDLTRFGFTGEVMTHPDLGRIVLTGRQQAGELNVTEVVLTMREPGSLSQNLDATATLERIEVRVEAEPSVILPALDEAFGKGKVAYYGTQGKVVQSYLVFAERHALADTSRVQGGAAWVFLYEPSALATLANERKLCSAACTYCTSACTACTEACTSSCTASCTACTASCTSGCTASCTQCTSCTSGCTASCTVGCTATCTGCTGSCTIGCTMCTSCTGSTSCFSTSCSFCTSCTGCTGSCTAGCTGSCTSCTGMCTMGCTRCTTGCTSSTGCVTCTSGCTACTECTEACTSCTTCTSCTQGCTGRTGRLEV